MASLFQAVKGSSSYPQIKGIQLPWRLLSPWQRHTWPEPGARGVPLTPWSLPEPVPGQARGCSAGQGRWLWFCCRDRRGRRCFSAPDWWYWGPGGPRAAGSNLVWMFLPPASPPHAAVPLPCPALTEGLFRAAEGQIALGFCRAFWAPQAPRHRSAIGSAPRPVPDTQSHHWDWDPN